MKKFFIAISLVLQITTITATPSHFTFFGDSYTDTGNFPEASNVSDPVFKNFTLYVPISNPVLLSPKDPMLPFLIKSIGQLSDLGQIDHQVRSNYSINWPLYLIYAFTKTTPLTTWYHFVTDPTIETDNMNYAWVSAMAGNPNGDSEMLGACFYVNFKPYLSDCNLNTVLNHRKEYQMETAQDPTFDKDHDYTYLSLQIPDLNKQVTFFLNDFQNRLPNGNAIFIYMGANDIGYFVKSHLIKIAFYNQSYFMSKDSAPQMQIVASYVTQAVNRIKAAYGVNKDYHIYILSLPHLSNIHQAYAYKQIPWIGSKLVQTLDNIVDQYNADLERLFQNDNQVSFIDSGSHMNAWANDLTFKGGITSGKACAEDPNYLTPSAAKTNNCHYTQNGMAQTYFGWNNSHFTAPVNKLLAKAVLQGMQP
jgi:hypothetical protein